MSAIEFLSQAKTESWEDEEGKTLDIVFKPGLSETRISAIERRIGAPLPTDFREFLGVCEGIDGLSVEVDFAGSSMSFGMEELMPHGHTIAADGTGNFWAIDSLTQRERTAQVFYVCHDAPVMLFQSGSIEDFLRLLLYRHMPGHVSLFDAVEGDEVFHVYSTNPGVLAHSEALASSDSQIRAFAATLDNRFSVIDLRNVSPGMGFSWGRYGADGEVRRFGEARIFAYAAPAKKAGLLDRIFGRK